MFLRFRVLGVPLKVPNMGQHKATPRMAAQLSICLMWAIISNVVSNYIDENIGPAYLWILHDTTRSVLNAQHGESAYLECGKPAQGATQPLLTQRVHVDIV